MSEPEYKVQEVKVKKNGSKKRMYFECFFAVFVICLVSAYLYGITFTDIPEANARVVDTVLGFLLGSVISPIVIWCFKNSKATVDKQNQEIKPIEVKSQ